jgi:2-methylfumaryl-CoA hydratase
VGNKASRGNFFEDFSLDQELVHAAPRTFREGDVALHVALTGSRFALQSSDHFARSLGLERAPIDDLLVFNVVFGKTVADISQNAVANLGYSDCRFLAPVYPGDSIRATSAVIGLKENSNGKTGVVHVRSTGRNQRDEPVLEYVRWVMVKKRDVGAPAPEPSPPELPDHVPAAELTLPPGLDFSAYDTALAGSAHLWDDYEPGERIDHVAGVTIEEAEHMMATRLYQNTARVHFDQLAAAESRWGRRIVYGGHVISLARGLSFNGLANACLIAAINAGRHVAPCFAGDTIHAWSEVLDKAALPGRADAGALRLRTLATKDHACEDFPGRDENGAYHAAVVLDLDYWAIMPRAR